VDPIVGFPDTAGGVSLRGCVAELPPGIVTLLLLVAFGYGDVPPTAVTTHHSE
jgi:hypothetical protein